MAATALGNAAAGPPLHVEVSEAKCFRPGDLHRTVAGADLFPGKLGDRAAIATVQLTFRSATRDGQKADFTVTVDGEQRSSGSVSGGGKSVNSVTIASDKDSRIVVTSGSTVVLDTMVAGRC
ncbi:hypothetical protein MOQ72_01470 [Saccharopolyspora sp. K220]|nr:hypothetical protein [Saccharopolyspora soli]